MCEVVSSYFRSVLFTVNEVAMTMDVHVCCAHMQLCIWMGVLCVVCMGGCACVYMLVLFCTFQALGSGSDSRRSAMASASRRPTSRGETGATRTTPAPSVRRYG